MNAPQKLRHGKFITAGNFPRFVETFNWLVDFCTNLRGDADAPNDFGAIKLDRSVDDHPVIRADAMKFGGGGRGGGVMPGCFEIRYAGTTGQSDTGGFENPYYTIGGIPYSFAQAEDIGFSFTSSIVVLKVGISGASPEPSIVAFGGFDDLQEAAKADRSAIYRPLYVVDKSGVAVADLRNIPEIQAWEFR